MRRRTIVGAGAFALTLLALVCIPRHLPSTASPLPLADSCNKRCRNRARSTNRATACQCGADDRSCAQRRWTRGIRRLVPCAMSSCAPPMARSSPPAHPKRLPGPVVLRPGYTWPVPSGKNLRRKFHEACVNGHTAPQCVLVAQ